jgi:phytoene dehydrogenase-like protein
MNIAIFLVIFLLQNRSTNSFTYGTINNIEQIRYHSQNVKNIPNCKTLRYSNSYIQKETDIEHTSSRDPAVVVVVGGGVGGLACASRIAFSCKELQHRTKVLVLEKNPKEMVGGRCGSFYRNVEGLGTFRHERGPSLLLLKDVYLDVFSDCDKRAADFGLEFKQCSPAYQVVFEDGDTIQLGFPRDLKGNVSLQEAEQRSREKMNSYENNGAAKWDEYMQSTEAFLNCGLPNFIEEKLDLGSFPSFLIEAMKDGMKVSLPYI